MKDNISPIWHPMTQHKIFKEQIYVDSAKGAHLYRKDGSKILDGISSWWVITHGHCHPKIVEAVQQQAGKLEQVIFAGFTHGPAEHLTAKIMEITPDNLRHAFYSDSGSTAIEIALKMAIGTHHHSGQKRSKIIALEDGYHGDTFGAMAAGARGVFSDIYKDHLFEVEFIPRPCAASCAQQCSLESCARDASIAALQDIIDRDGNNIAAFIFEPIVQGAAGMQAYDAATLKTLHDMVRGCGGLTIADEVMTGFGRLGTRFACEQAQIESDLVCLSKGLTGGFLPMGLTLTTRDIYMAFYDEDRSKTFFHSTSFTGNPLACAAALTNLQLWDEEPVFENIARIEAQQKQAANAFASEELITSVRQHGTIIAMDVHDEAVGYLSTLGPWLYNYFLERDILLRPIGNCIYILPPYCITNAELEQIYDTIRRALRDLRDGRQQSAA